MSIDFSLYKRTVFLPVLLLSQVAATAGTLTNTTSPVNILPDDVKKISIDTAKIFQNIIKVDNLGNIKELLKAEIGSKRSLPSNFKSIITSFQELKFSRKDRLSMAQVQILARTGFSKTDKGVYDFDIQKEDDKINSEPTLENLPAKQKTASLPAENNQPPVPSMINVPGEGVISIGKASSDKLSSKSKIPTVPTERNLLPRNFAVGSALSGINEYANISLGENPSQHHYNALAGYNIGANPSYSFNTGQRNGSLANIQQSIGSRIRQEASLKAVQETNRRIQQQKSLFSKIAQEDRQQEKLQQDSLVRAQKLQEETIRRNYTQNY